MTKVELSYVISAPLFGLFPNIILENLPEKEHIKTLLNEYSETVHSRIASSCQHYKPSLGCLYNGYTEENQIANFKYYGNLGFRSIYADSGGLQIVTRGATVTDEIKEIIYKNQAFADYAMCFDVIKLRNESLVRTKNERSNIFNKVFLQDEHYEAAVATANNVKAQIEAFKRIGAKTQVIIIVQGNDRDDMLMFYREIEKRLTPEDYDYVGGVAIADTCIGNGQLESVEMLRAAHEISRNAHPNISQHLHLLGVGSVFRMVPVVFLKQSGYLDNINYISYDSSTHSQSFAFGVARLDGGTTRLGTRRNHVAVEYFSKVYEYFKEPMLAGGVTIDKFLEIIYGDNSEDWSIAKINQRNTEAGDQFKTAIGYVLKSAHTFYQVDNFCKSLDGLFSGEFKLNDKHTYMLALKNLRDDQDVVEWKRHQKQTKKIRSKRIRREEDLRTIEGIFG